MMPSTFDRVPAHASEINQQIQNDIRKRGRLLALHPDGAALAAVGL